MPPGGGNQIREHLLINYATEDWALADWLTRKLTAEGYRVWCDRFKLLGGESYPREIDDAIKNRTFRMVSLLSHASLAKQAHTAARQRTPAERSAAAEKAAQTKGPAKRHAAAMKAVRTKGHAGLSRAGHKAARSRANA